MMQLNKHKSSLFLKITSLILLGYLAFTPLLTSAASSFANFKNSSTSAISNANASLSNSAYKTFEVGGIVLPIPELTASNTGLIAPFSFSYSKSVFCLNE